jgi:hypothetical protein
LKAWHTPFTTNNLLFLVNGFTKMGNPLIIISGSAEHEHAENIATVSGKSVLVGVCVIVLVGVCVCVIVFVGVLVNVGVCVGVLVLDGVFVLVTVFVGVGVGQTQYSCI